MNPTIRIENNAQTCHIDIEGTIGVPESWQFEEPEERVATYDKFRETVRRIGDIASEEVVVHIRSTGGDVNDALLIHDALRQTGAHITTRCYGYTASAATIIAQAASEGCREISANALYLIHDSICATEGNASELACKTDLLRQTDDRIAALYAARAGRDREQYAALMAENNGAGRWLSPEQTVAAGLADTIVDVSPKNVPTLATNLVRGWRRLLATVGLSEGEMPSDDRNMLHFDEDVRALSRRSALSAVEARKRIGPTQTLPREDPSCCENIPTANQRAYGADARQFRKA